MPHPSSLFLGLVVLLAAFAVRADETCQSPYLPKLVGQEEFVYIWTVGMDGVGDGSDKLVTIAVAPVLADFGQDALPLIDEEGREFGVYRHVLKVFLVDAEGAVRNVYSADFLSADLLAIDARTVLLEAARTARAGFGGIP